MFTQIKLPIKFKILMIALVAILGFAIITAVQYSINLDNHSRLNAVKNIYYPVLEYLDKNQVVLDKIINTLNAAVSDGEMEMLEDADQMADEMRKDFIAAADLDDQSRESLNYLLQQFNEYYVIARALTAGMIDEVLSREQIQNNMKAMSEKINLFRTGLNDLRDKSYSSYVQALDNTQTSSAAAMNTMIVVILICVAVLIVTALFISRKVSDNLQAVIESLRRIASGDLTCELTTNSRDEVGEVVESCNILVEKLRAALTEVANSADNIASSAETLFSTAEQSSCHAVDQQSRLEQIATASNEMSSSIQEVAGATSNAAMAANAANTEANKGSSQANKAVETLNRMRAAIERGAGAVGELQVESSNIGTVLDVIRSIAEQTNLLALNAAIEAARAGEAGRGFAVVADEVRTLASRTQDATSEIQSMIEKLQERSTHTVSVMEESTRCSDETELAVNNGAAALKNMSEHAVNINDLNTQIASATEQQSAVAEEVNRNIHEVSECSRQTAEEARTNANESKLLTEQAAHLKMLVSGFTI